MAMSVAVKEDFDDLLTCTICLETFKEPKYLPCLHTFCKSCINTYIGSTVKWNNPNEFKCPVCRRSVPIDENDEKPDTWADNSPGNHFIVSLIYKRELQKPDKLCDTCDQDKQKAISFCTVCEEAYCESCRKGHRIYKISKSHKIIPITDINADTSMSGLYACVTCKEHPDKTIEVYCQDHSKPCCTVCATVNHRKCEQVVTIDKAVIGIKESDKATNLMTKLTETSHTLEEVLQNQKTNKENFKNGIETVLEEITKLRENLCKHLNELEEKLKKEANSNRKEKIIKLDDETTDLSSLKNTVDNWKKIFEACISQGSEIQCLVMMDEILNNLPKTGEDISKLLREMKTISIKFEHKDVISDIVSLGRLIFNEYRPSIPGMKIANYHTGKIRKVFTIDDTMHAVSGIFFNNDIILTHYCQYKIVYYDNKGQEQEQLDIPHILTDIAKVNDQTVAVSSHQQKIVVINVKPLTILKTLNISNPVWGISFCENEFVTTYDKTISWLNAENGTVVRSKQTQVNGRYVYCYQKNEYILWDSGHSIKRESNQGNSFTYNNSLLKGPFFQDVDSDGNIYIIGNESKNIHQLTSTGQLVRIIPLTDIDNTITGHPWVIRFKPNSNRFILTFFTGSNQVLVCEIGEDH
ncbi:transcription intermediary factor 1-alpha-like isoform X2 [Mytilus californianus]|uniref:transcription intermediary factor 1-alpha-like isoform X2 n=1 Tax=Mytilus californianus TaxID=6549 RepID=UPI00224743C5|nr:transcription intermediary factor 1-alpha-like isoform X2 [Mytilus californianus]